MVFEEAFFTYLSGSVDRPGYPVVFPDKVTFPAWRYQRITGAPGVTHDGDSGVESVRIQVSCYGLTYAEVKAMAAQVKTALSGYSGAMGAYDTACRILNETDLYEAEGKLHHTAIDVEILATT